MKRLIFILFLFCSVLQAQTTWYIAPPPTGNDGSGSGTAGSPWATLYKATSSVPAVVGDPGDIIHINSGTYIETHASLLEPTISIEGEGYSSHIKSHVANAGNFEGVIQLVSGGLTDGSQSLHDFRLDGDNYSGYKAISVYKRNHVSIYALTVEDFMIEGIRFGGTTQSHGNSVYACNITNCGWWDGSDQHANLIAEYTTGMTIYGNTITVENRGDGHSGTGIESFGGLTDCKIYSNTIFNNPQAEGLFEGKVQWAFSIETFHTGGGIEIYDNTISGKIDWGNQALKGAYAYSVSFHDNIVGPATMESVYTDGIQFEYASQDVKIYNNLFKNLERPIYFCIYLGAGEFIENVDIYNNIMYNIGTDGRHVGGGIYFETYNIPPDYVENVNIYNNTIIGSSTDAPLSGIYLPTAHTVHNVFIRNNIIQGFNTASVHATNQHAGGTIDYLYIQNNLFYGNGNSNAPLFSGITPTHVIGLSPQTNLLGSNPAFVNPAIYNYHLANGSPADGAGYGTTLSVNDYDGVAWASPPAIGGFEYIGASLAVPAVTTTAITGISSTGASSGGNVTSDGGAAVTARGVCWSTGNNPTTASSHTTNGTGTGVFTSAITGLTEGLRYYVRAYATNSVGTAYGAELSFVAVTGYSLEGTGQLLKIGNVMVKIGSNLVKY